MAELLALSQGMVMAARAGEWDSVLDLELQRQASLEQLPAHLVAAETSHEVGQLWRDTIRSIIDADKEVELLAEASKKELAQEMSELGSSRKAVNAYLDNLAP